MPGQYPYQSGTGGESPPPDLGRYVRLGIMAITGIVIVAVAGSQAAQIFIDVNEFEDLYTRPLYYLIISGLALSAIALVRVDIRNRHSITWYFIGAIISFAKSQALGPQTRGAGGAGGGGWSGSGSSGPSFSGIVSTYGAGFGRFREFKLSAPAFTAWQITKVLLLAAFFSNLMFGVGMQQILFEGNYLGAESVKNIFSLPFATPPDDPSYAQERVVPMIPFLTLIIPSLLSAIGVRLGLFVGFHHMLNIITDYIQDSQSGTRPKVLQYISTIEFIAGVFLLWTTFNMFFVDQIDYNTKYAISAVFAGGIALIGYSFFDKSRSKVVTHPLKRDTYIKIGVLLALAIGFGTIMAVNDSIANAKKIEWLGPYRAQEIGVNRYLGRIDDIRERSFELDVKPVSANQVDEITRNNTQVLDNVRIWDWEAAFAKLKPEIGLIPYVDFENNDILRFNNTLYWTASMKPIIPSSVQIQDRWYNEHFVYTHVPNGFLTLDASEGAIVNSADLFAQRTIYYGEGGLFETASWSAYPTNRGNSTAELNKAFYEGRGGVDIPPGLSWVFEPNFMISYPTEPIHIMRYKDINERMRVVYPYFQYQLFGQNLDAFPVTDRKDSTFWAVPLILGLNTQHVPWSDGNPYLRLVGFSLLDTYHGDTTLIKTGDDFFAEAFAEEYKQHFREMPAWIEDQTKYPVELFKWRTQMYNTYHVTEPNTFIQGKNFFEIPRGLQPYYITSQPPGFEQTEFVGLLSLELRGSQGRNLAGYIISENDGKDIGRLTFYEVPLDSETKLLGPSAVEEALNRDPEYAKLSTLLRNPRVGDNILYRIGEHDVYFIPVYTAGSGGVVSQIGTIASVGATYEGEYHVGIGNSTREAFEAYLFEVAQTAGPGRGGVPSADGKATNGAGGEFDSALLQRSERMQELKELFAQEIVPTTGQNATAGAAIQGKQLEFVTPESINIPLRFQDAKISFFNAADLQTTKDTIEQFVKDIVEPRTNRMILWEKGNAVNIGTVITKEGVLELHYITVNLGQKTPQQQEEQSDTTAQVPQQQPPNEGGASPGAPTGGNNNNQTIANQLFG